MTNLKKLTYSGIASAAVGAVMMYNTTPNFQAAADHAQADRMYSVTATAVDHFERNRERVQKTIRNLEQELKQGCSVPVDCQLLSVDLARVTSRKTVVNRAYGTRNLNNLEEWDRHYNTLVPPLDKIADEADAINHEVQGRYPNTNRLLADVRQLRSMYDTAITDLKNDSKVLAKELIDQERAMSKRSMTGNFTVDYMSSAGFLVVGLGMLVGAGLRRLDQKHKPNQQPQTATS